MENNLTPSEQAQRLLRNMTVDFDIDSYQTKQCAIKCCESILELPILSQEDIDYWQEVLIQLEKI